METGAPLPGRRLFLWRGLFGFAFLAGGGVRFEHDFVARAGDVDGDAFAAQFPGQQVGGGDVFFGGAGGEVDGFGERVVDKGLQGGLHAHVLVGADVGGDDEGGAHGLGQLGDVLAGAVAHDLFEDTGACLGLEVEGFERFFKLRAGVGEGEVFAVVVDVAEVGQGEDRLAAVAFAAGHGGDGAGGGDGGLGGVADAVGVDVLDEPVPIDGGAAPVAGVGDERDGRLPLEHGRVVDAALDGGEGAAGFGQVDAGAHAVVADEFHHLSGKFLAFERAVADADVVEQVGQAHDAEADAAGAVGGFFELRHRRDVGVGFDDIVEEDGGENHALAQFVPVYGAVGAEVLGQVDRTKTAVFEGT